MKFLIVYITIFFISTFNLIAQNKFSLGVNYSVNIDNSLFTGTNKDYFSGIQPDIYSPKGYNLGFVFKYRLTKNLQLLSGIQTTKKSIAIKISGDDLGLSDNDDGIGFIGKYYSVDLPVGLSHKLIDKKILLSLSYGIFGTYTHKFNGVLSKILLINLSKIPSSVTYSASKTNDPTIPKIQQLTNEIKFEDINANPHRKINFLPFVSVEIGVKISPKISFCFAPLIRYSIFNQSNNNFRTTTVDVISNSNVELYKTKQIFWNVGLNTNLVYSF